MSTNDPPIDSVISFLRKRDYVFKRTLGQGGCGQTVLLHDDQIDEFFVCKKYHPWLESQREELFANFVREIKLLHKIHHDNLVRIFNYYLYPDVSTGYILMEFIDGQDIDDYVADAPHHVNELFAQTIAGFAHLEARDILHRDIRPGNLMVRGDGRVKIIDLGFGKQVQTSADFKKSITLNWWCEPPMEFESSLYNFTTEIYFVGKLFEKLLRENSISHFKYGEILRRMCDRNPETRVATFALVQQEIGRDLFLGLDFSATELAAH